MFDTSKTLRGVTLDPSHAEMLPVGHVALDNQDSKAEKLGLDLPTRDAFWIKSLYVSYALQGLGLGGSAMDMAESVATSEPLNAKHLLLDTVLKDDVMNEEIAVAYFGQLPKVGCLYPHRPAAALTRPRLHPSFGTSEEDTRSSAKPMGFTTNPIGAARTGPSGLSLCARICSNWRPRTSALCQAQGRRRLWTCSSACRITRRFRES